MSYTIRPMTRDEADIAVSWGADEGWNPGKDDAEAFYNTDPEGFLVGLLDGEPIATISAIAYDGSFGFLGHYIVKPGYRGEGYGIGIWDEAMKRLARRNAGLDGVLEQQAAYERSGFTLAYRGIRHEGTAPDISSRPQGIVSISEVPFERVLAYDAAHFPVARAGFLGGWLSMPRSTGLAAVRDGELAGYGVVRECSEGYKIGPLFADDASTADDLFRALTGTLRGGSLVYLDTPGANPEAVRLAERHGMTPVFETVRMYNRSAPDLPLDQVFGVTTFELG